MGALLLFILCIVNFAISCWNSYAAGQIWRESKGWMKIIAWSAVIMSVCGFLSVTTIVLGFISLSVGIITAEGFKALIALTYLFIIFPVLGAGFAITIESWKTAIKRRDFASGSVAAWNTFAQVSNTWDALDGGISSAFKDVSSFFGKSDDDDKDNVAVLLILLIASIIAGGLTYVFFLMGRRHSLSRQMLEA